MTVFDSLPEDSGYSNFSKSSLMMSDEEFEKDVLYDSLCSLTNPLKHKTKRQLKTQKLSPALSFDEKKTLTLVLNECFSTDGKGPVNLDESEKLGIKRVLYDKTINSIGTSLSNCDLSDNISIDIEGESTYLPLMCKLMIIVEGAAYERGKRLLLNDAACQVGEGNLLSLESEFEHDLPIMIESTTKDHLVRNQNPNENTLMKIRSTENINYDEYNQQMDQISYQRRFNNRNAFERKLRAGSLTNLNTSDSSLSDNSGSGGSNYFSKRVEKINLELYEYLSTPFYGYQRKATDKVDFSNGIQEEFIVKKSIETQTTTTTIEEKTTTTTKTAKMFQDSVEVHIPIRLEFPEEPAITRLEPVKLSSEERDNNKQHASFRNERHIIIGNEHTLNNHHCDVCNEDHFTMTGFRSHKDIIDQLHSFRLLSNNMRQYCNMRQSRLETDYDLNFFREEGNDIGHICHHHHHHHPHLHHHCHNHPTLPEAEPYVSTGMEPRHVIEVHHTDQSEDTFDHSVCQSMHMESGRDTPNRRKASVTNLMFMRVVNGNLITSI